MRSLELVLPLLLVFAACGKSAAEAPTAKGPGRPVAFPVEVQPVAAEKVEYRVSAVGSVEAFEEVQVTARVPGAVERLAFAEGDRVKAGALLLEIEPRRYQLQVESTQARVEQVEAQAAEAAAALARRSEANDKRPGLVKAEEIETARTKVAVAKAAAAEAQASLHLAELNLRDAVVRAPMDGVIERRAARTGQYVQPGALLATLVRREPLLLRFKIPEQDAARVSVGATVTFNAGGDRSIYQAQVIHVAQAADEATRMVAATAKVTDPNKDRLRPGAFAEVSIPVAGLGQDAAPVIPQTAVRPSERGFLTFVVEDGVAKERVVELGLRTDSGLVEVKSGLKVGEPLVIRGTEALRDGAKVQVKENTP